MTTLEDTDDTLPPLDVRHGIKALAGYIRKTERQTYYLVTTGKIPARQIGGRWSWSPSKVREALLGEPAQ